ncbi:unnamed protein product [Soboliphyme baturini]|uniref:Secreted protein n=1 Tax=Soboliphyme baturini TaxID=241478 RepID=A0A183J7D0_9BILA|nr:unnamed protein product [Soboliphyme baturini]
MRLPLIAAQCDSNSGPPGRGRNKIPPMATLLWHLSRTLSTVAYLFFAMFSDAEALSEAFSECATCSVPPCYLRESAA